MKTEILITSAIMLCAFTIPMTCATSPSITEASAAQEVIISSVDSLRTGTIETIEKGIELVGDVVLPKEEQTDCDVVIDSMNTKSSKIDDDISEIKKDLEELKKRKKIKKITKKKIKKKKIIDK
jgi:hypothetical protein|tara:strand:+ start:210 stop:581 length:372 start_codon:yes stop_codon:yes gene_type:complete